MRCLQHTEKPVFNTVRPFLSQIQATAGRFHSTPNFTPSHVCFGAAKDAHLKEGNLPTPAAEPAAKSLIKSLSIERTTGFPRQRPNRQARLLSHIKRN